MPAAPRKDPAQPGAPSERRERPAEPGSALPLLLRAVTIGAWRAERDADAGEPALPTGRNDA